MSAYPGKTHDIVATLRDGRVIAYAQYGPTVVSAGAQGITITFPDLKRVDYVLEIEFHTDPLTSMESTSNKKIEGNVVGLTVYPAAGTTLTADALAIGPP